MPAARGPRLRPLNQLLEGLRHLGEGGSEPALRDNAIAIPIAAGVFEPAFGLVLRPEIAALSMSDSSLLVAVNAMLLRKLQLPAP